MGALMFDYLFSFRGRIGRMQYFLRSLVASVALVVLVVLAVLVGVGGSNRPNLGALGLALLLMIPILVAAVWSGLSLQARRFRDIGWEPTFVLPVWIVAQIVLQMMFTPMAVLTSGHGNTSFGSFVPGLLNLVMWGILLFWPGNGGSDIDRLASTFDLPEPDEPVRTVRPMPTKPAWAAPQPARVEPAPSSAYRTQPAPGGFGRRGL